MNSTPAFKQYKITMHFNYEPSFNGAFSRDNLPRIKKGVFVINFDDKQNK